MIQNITPYSYYNVCVCLYAVDFSAPFFGVDHLRAAFASFCSSFVCFSKLFSPSFAPACV